MHFLKATLRISFLFFFCWIGLFASAQTETALTKYQNDKYRFSFSYPSQYLLEVVNDDEWIISNTDHSWAIGFKIMHLQGGSFENYVNNLAASLYTTLANAYGLSATSSKIPEKNPYANYQLSGFEFGLYISGSLGNGKGLDKLVNAWNLYLNVFKKTSQAGFAPDGILIYDFRSPIDVDNHKLTKQVINSFAKTIQFGKSENKIPVTIPVKPKQPVSTKPVGKPTVATQVTEAKTVTIGTQIWMTENLNVSKFRNGNLIPQAKTEKEWENASIQGKAAWCYFDNDPSNESKYGKLYNWYAVNDKRGLAPKGWHVPANEEYKQLINFLGKDAGHKMKATSGWEEIAGYQNGSNESGFTGLPGKNRWPSGTFTYAEGGNYWSSTKPGKEAIYLCFIRNYKVALLLLTSAGDGCSVKCIRD